MLDLSRRSFLRGLVAAPAVIAIERLMPVKLVEWTVSPHALRQEAMGGLMFAEGGPGAIAWRSILYSGKTHFVPNLAYREIDLTP